ncbi:47 kDa outer membrane protein precursor [compost metagenome]
MVRYLADKTSLKLINIQPTLSYQINDDLSVGAGLIASYARATLGSRLPITDGSIEAKGDDWGYGYNIGVLYQLAPHTRVGLTYHSKVKYDLNTETKVRNLFPLLGPANANIDGSLKATTPESVEFSVTHELDSRWTLYTGAIWTRWSRWPAITIENSNSPTPLFDIISQDLKWHDSWGYTLGASYQVSPQWVLRAGVALDDSPAGRTENARLPVADRKIFSVGAGWRASENLTVDVAYSYLRQGEFTLTQQDDTGNRFQADYKVAAHGLGLQLNYQF